MSEIDFDRFSKPGQMKANEIIKSLTNKQLSDIAHDLNSQTGMIAMDGTTRLVASKVYDIPVTEVNLLQILGLAPLVALELSHRLDSCKEDK